MTTASYPAGGPPGGWSPEEQAAADMTRRLDEVLRPYAWHGKIPEDAALICHPVLYYALLRVSAPSFPGFMAGGIRLQVPVVVDPALPHGRWQLLLAQGGIPEPRLAVVREMVPGLEAP